MIPNPLQQPHPNGHTPPPPSWYWSLPYVAVALFIATMAALLWLIHRQDEEEQRTTLINDVLWMEQNFSFLFERNNAQLAELGPDLLGGRDSSAVTKARVKRALDPENGLVRILWLKEDSSLQGSEPPYTDKHLVGESAGTFPSPSALRLARALGRPVYSDAYAVIDNQTQFEVHIPIHDSGRHLGTVIGVYSTNNLLTHQIPWWFSERYRVAITNNLGTEIAAKSKVSPLSSLSYEIPFDPPGHGLNLDVTAYRSEIRWIPLLLMSSLCVLAGAIVWSLWQLRRHMQRRQAAEQALRSEHAFRKTMEDSISTGMRARALDGTITYVNPAFCRMVGWSADELVGLRPPMPYWPPEALDQALAAHSLILSGNAPSQGLEIRLMRRNGERFDALLIEAPLIDADGRHIGWMGSMVDISEQKRAQELARQQEERLQATSRLVTMGEMASTLAHELNQPLAAISSYITGCQNMLAQGPMPEGELGDIFTKVGKQAQRAAQIIRRVHAFVRRSEPKCESVDINTILREAIGLVEPDAQRRGVRIDIHLTEPLPWVAADPVMIEQVAINLIRNGMDAMAEAPRHERVLTLTTRLQDDMVLLSVADQGRGIPPEVAEKLFAPFFTTKAEGMGMGLNICRSIAELHRGRLSFEAHPGGGTLFHFSLPVQDTDA
ncbi:sensor histidine kinase [Zoogloea sp.]|uniref:sensor histidine kinase n=1 Tax=Zoogloea sp. TaxID=49181 RepID=UPI0035B299E0